jgi:hypothetical protein
MTDEVTNSQVRHAQVQIKFERNKPFELAFTNEEEERSYRQSLTKDPLAAYITKYLECAADLLHGDLQTFRPLCPRYLTGPVKVLAAVCPNGIGVRFDPIEGTSHEVVVLRTKVDLRDVATQFSAGFIHFSGHAPNESTAPFTPPELRMTIVDSSGSSIREVGRNSLGIHADWPDERPDSLPGRKPYCPIGVLSTLSIEMQGVEGVSEEAIALGRPFSTRGPIRLDVSWDYIEIYPLASAHEFKPELAGAWAERDILAVVNNRISQELDWQTRASQVLFRRRARQTLIDFEDLLKRNGKEEEIHQFIRRHPELLSPIRKRVLSKMAFGKTISDFVVEQADGTYILVELEHPEAKLFNAKDHFSASLTHAIGQIIDWKRYIADNKSTVERELGLARISPDSPALLVIGRSAELTQSRRDHLRTYLVSHPTLVILTYDDLLVRARQGFENAYGRIEDPGGSMQLIYE